MISDADENAISHSLFNIAHESSHTAEVSFEYVTSLLLDLDFAQCIQRLNPFLSQSQISTAESLLVTALFCYNRAGLVARCIAIAADISDSLDRLTSIALDLRPEALSAMSLKSNSLAELLNTKRKYAKLEEGCVVYDPRFLLFEFTSNLVLRDSQVALVERFVEAYKSGGSLCHQLIMGAGKTTVIAPLLALILGSPSRLVVQVCCSAFGMQSLWF